VKPHNHELHKWWSFKATVQFAMLQKLTDTVSPQPFLLAYIYCAKWFHFDISIHAYNLV
jgi:hypothetical protein